MDTRHIILVIIGVIIVIFFIIRFGKRISRTGIKRTRGERIGARGEYNVQKSLGRDIPNERYIINDVLVTHDGKSSQIDHVMISKFGIFVIETKNLSGWIYGTESQREWSQVLGYGNVKHQLYSPVLQNEGHINQLKKVLRVNKGFISIIVFPRANISNVNTVTHVGNIYSMKKKIHTYQKIIFSSKEINRMYNILADFKDNPTITDEEHVRKIKERKKALEQGVCPWCGGNLVLRQGKYGNFYGCSNFPKYQFSANIQ